MSTLEFSTTSRLDKPEDLIPKEKNWPKREKKKKGGWVTGQTGEEEGGTGK